MCSPSRGAIRVMEGGESDHLPIGAIDRIDVLNATSVFGLNALGGAMTVTMKNGFTYQGFDTTLSGGSFNQRQAQAEYGVNDGTLGAYVAVNGLKQGGWRHFAQDRVLQYYLDLSFHTDTITADLSYSRGNNRLFGQGAAPVQSLAISPDNVFTGPQNNINNDDMITLNTAYNFLTSTLSIYLSIVSRCATCISLPRDDVSRSPEPPPLICCGRWYGPLFVTTT